MPNSPATTARISIHALREEGDHSWHRQPHTPRYFYPRPPRGGRLPCSVLLLLDFKFLSTPSARRATMLHPMDSTNENISIHALREEGDDNYLLKGVTNHDFYPRPPRGGRRSW